MTLWIKNGVRGQEHLHPKLQKSIGRIHKWFNDHDEDMYITSFLEGTHSGGSFHYIGRAVDFLYPREFTLSKQQLKIAVEGGKIGADFDIVYHPYHIHVEYDPK